MSQIKDYAVANGFENLDYLLEKMIYEGGFGALVIIDELSEELEAVLVRQFKFPVEVITLSRYSNEQADRIYQFEPFLADVTGPEEVPGGGAEPSAGRMDIAEVDTIVVPAREDGFKEVFLGENRWYAIRIHGSMIPRIKHIAAYRVAPISAVTHIARVGSIERWKESDKYVVNFAQPAVEINPVPLVKKGKVKQLQGPRYTSHERLLSSKTLDEAF